MVNDITETVKDDIDNVSTTTHHLCSVLQQIPNVVDSDSKDDDSVGASWQVVG